MKEGWNEEKRKNGRKGIRMKSMIGFGVVIPKQSKIFSFLNLKFISEKL